MQKVNPLKKQYFTLYEQYFHFTSISFYNISLQNYTKAFKNSIWPILIKYYLNYIFLF